jgi:hypothetical protein
MRTKGKDPASAGTFTGSVGSRKKDSIGLSEWPRKVLLKYY